MSQLKRKFVNDANVMKPYNNELNIENFKNMTHGNIVRIEVMSSSTGHTITMSLRPETAYEIADTLIQVAQQQEAKNREI